MALGHYLHLRLFLEGVEIPVISANTTVAANTPASASIQVIATDKVLDLLPRTVVHLFYYDYVGAGNPVINQKVTGSAVDRLNQQYKLLFMGELQQINFQKGFGSRSVILQCVDFSNYWDTTYQYNFGGSLFGGRRQAAFIGANANFFTSPLGHGVGTISRLLSGRSVNYPELRGLLSGVVRMLEAIGGSYRGRNAFRGANDFTSIAELRIKVLQQITAAAKDTSTARLFARKAFNMWMNRQTGKLGRLVTFRGLVKLMFKFIFHEVYPCPVAKFVKSGVRTDKRHYSVALDKTEKYYLFANKTEVALQRVHYAVAALDSWKKHRDASAFRKYVWAGITAERAVKGVYAAGSALVGSGGSQAKIQGKLCAALEGIRKISTISVMGRHYIVLSSLWGKVESALEDILKARVGRTSSKIVATGERVNNQIFRPDVWFTPPPRCNVLFPETYDNFTFGRNFMREVTRMELQTHNEILGNSKLFNGRYYAPNIEDVRRGVKLSSRRFARLIMEHELYTGIIPMFENLSEANLFAMRSSKVSVSGAKVPYAQRSVNHQYFKYRFESRQLQAAGRFNPMIVPGFPTLIIDRHLDATDLKISAMTVGEQTRALGLLAADLKSFVGSSSKSIFSEPPTKADLLRQLVSPQYLGTLASLSHTVSQDGGRSQYAFMQAHVHREDTEYLGVDKAVVKKAIPGSGTTHTTPVAYPLDFPPKKGMRGPKGMRIVKVKNVTKAYSKPVKTGETLDVVDARTGKVTRKETVYAGKTLPLLGTKLRVAVGSQIKDTLLAEVYARAGVGAASAAVGALGETLGEFASSAVSAFTGSIPRVKPKKKTAKKPYSEDLVIGAFLVTESNVKYRREKIDLPIEDAIAPPWIWDGWRNPKVGETYQEMFGTTAITDISNFDAATDSKSLMGRDAVAASQSEKQGKSAGKTKTKKGLIAKDKKHANAVLMIEQQRTIENSVDFLVRAYSFAKINTLDIGDFLRAYTCRPVATMVDILGSADLQILPFEEYYTSTVKRKYVKKKGETMDIVDARTGKVVGQEVREPVYGTRYDKKRRKRTRYKATGKEGFHSRAFGDVEDLFGLVSPTVTRVLGLSGKGRRKVAARLDVRKRRRAQVRAYVAELIGSRGLIG